MAGTLRQPDAEPVLAQPHRTVASAETRVTRPAVDTTQLRVSPPLHWRPTVTPPDCRHQRHALCLEALSAVVTAPTDGRPALSLQDPLDASPAGPGNARSRRQQAASCCTPLSREPSAPGAQLSQSPACRAPECQATCRKATVEPQVGAGGRREMWREFSTPTAPQHGPGESEALETAASPPPPAHAFPRLLGTP